MDYLAKMRECLAKVIALESVESESLPSAPFGAGVRAALSCMLQEGNALGFKTVDYDGYVGEIILGEGSKSVGILCHLDVVPAGDGWTYPPFALTEKEGRFYGRGVVDDKGAACACLYAMARIKEEGLKLNSAVRLILGCDEESGWKCMEHFKKVAPMPSVAFSPDADFPVIYAEKGILHIKLEFEADKLQYFSCGERVNMVPSNCLFKADADLERAKAKGIELREGMFCCFGVSAHGSTPEKGVNAMQPAINFLCEEGVLNKEVYGCLFGERYGLTSFSDETGNLTFSPNLARIERRGALSVYVDIRFPATMRKEEVLEEIKKRGGNYSVEHYSQPLYLNKDSELVRTLSDVYSEATGKKCAPVAIGGGTYARAMDNAVAFGPEMPGELSTAHCADENMKAEDFYKLFEIYYLAIKRLSGAKA